MRHFNTIVSSSLNITGSLTVTGSIYHLPASSSNRNFISVNTASGQFYYNNFYSEVKYISSPPPLMTNNVTYVTASTLSNFNLPVPGLYEVDITLILNVSLSGLIFRLNGPACSNWSGYVSDVTSSFINIPDESFGGFTSSSRRHPETGNESLMIMANSGSGAVAKFFINVSNVNAPLNLEWRQQFLNPSPAFIETGSFMKVTRVT